MLTIASSGSKLGSTPNSKSLLGADGPPTGAAPVPPSSSGMLALLSAERIGEDIRASERRCAPGATVSRCLEDEMKSLTVIKQLHRKSCVRIIAAIDVVHKCLKHSTFSFLDAISERNNVHRDVVLLQLLCKLNHRILICFWRRCNKHNYTLTQVLVLSMLQRELGNGESDRNVDFTSNFACCGMDASQNMTKVFGMCYQNLWPTKNGVSY